MYKVFKMDLNNNERCFLFYLYYNTLAICYVSELAEVLGVSKRTMTKIIKKTIDLGLVEREYVPNGRSTYSLRG